MPDDISDRPVDQQGKPRRVGRDLVAVEEADGAVHLRPLRQVPGPLWRSNSWRRCALPSWANDLDNPTDQFLALVVHLASRQQDAIDALEGILTDLREARRQSKAGAPAADVTPLIDKIGIRLLDLYRALDQ